MEWNGMPTMMWKIDGGCGACVVCRAVGDGHLGQLLPPLWGLLTEGLPEHERFVMADSGGGEGENDGAEKGKWGA